MSSVAWPTQIGPYEIRREIGRGGMGVVFAARDTRLERDVAVKALPEALARHPDRLARFQREARMLAALNHPHVASIYGLEEFDGRSYLVLEYVEGETLEATLKRRGALPVEEALAIALQIARAVEAAHERGVIHRDLKPANVKFTAAGDVKVLDFGLAKALGVGDGASALGSLANGTDGGGGGGNHLTQPPPPVSGGAAGSSAATIPGLILGSPGYLSPEQARGQPADRRTDVFSFGCLIYEMLVGQSLFAGQSVGDSIGATLYKNPDWSQLPPDTPPTVRLLLRRCLQKDPRKRLHDMADACLDLEEAIADPTGSMMTLAARANAPPRKPWARRGAAVLLGFGLLVLGVAAGWLGATWRARAAAAPTASPLVQFDVFTPDGTTIVGFDNSNMNGLAISVDGKLLAFTVVVGGQRQVWVRELSTGQSREIAAARGAAGPFFSPDGRWLAFVKDNRLLKASLEGGPASPICRGVSPIGRAAWLDNGRIVFTGAVGNGLYWVNADGGEPRMFAETDRDKPPSETAESPNLGFGGVHPLPDGRSVIASIWDGSTLDDYQLVVVDTETGNLTRVLSHATSPVVLESGLLVFLRNSTLLAVEFDLERMTPVGQPQPVLEGVLAEGWAADAQFALSPNGTLAYIPGGRTAEDRRLVLLDRQGMPTPLTEPDAIAGQLALAGDGRYVTVSTLRRKLELWVYDLQRRTMSLVVGEGEPYEPVWSPDGTELAFTLEGQNASVVRKRVFSTDPHRVILAGSGYYPASWTPDGHTLLLNFENSRGDNQNDIVALDLRATERSASTATPVIATPADEGSVRVSPDGRWILYGSDVSGQPEVHIARFPFDGRSWQVSVGGGGRPMWDGQGGAYFVSDEEELFAVSLALATDGEPTIGVPQLLFDLKPVVATSSWNYLAPLPGGGFVAVAPAPWETQTPKIRMAVNWGEHVAERIGAERKGP